MFYCECTLRLLGFPLRNMHFMVLTDCLFVISKRSDSAAYSLLLKQKIVVLYHCIFISSAMCNLLQHLIPFPLPHNHHFSNCICSSYMFMHITHLYSRKSSNGLTYFQIAWGCLSRSCPPCISQKKNAEKMTLNLTYNEFPYFFPQIKGLSFFFVSASSILARVQLAIQMNFRWIAFNLSSLEGRESYIL